MHATGHINLKNFALYFTVKFSIFLRERPPFFNNCSYPIYLLEWEIYSRKCKGERLLLSKRCYCMYLPPNWTYRLLKRERWSSHFRVLSKTMVIIRARKAIWPMSKPSPETLSWLSRFGWGDKLKFIVDIKNLINQGAHDA